MQKVYFQEKISKLAKNTNYLSIFSQKNTNYPILATKIVGFFENLQSNVVDFGQSKKKLTTISRLIYSLRVRQPIIYIKC